MTTRFDRALLPPAKTFYEQETGKLSRPDHKGNCLGNCPFHESKSRKSFSVNLNTGLWFCHGGCGGGDMISFVMRREEVDFKRAAQSLGSWLEEPTPEDCRALERRKQERERGRAELEALQERGRAERIQFRDEILADTRLMREISADLAEDRDND